MKQHFTDSVIGRPRTAGTIEVRVGFETCAWVRAAGGIKGPGMHEGSMASVWLALCAKEVGHG